MENCNPSKTPMDVNVKLTKTPDDEIYPEVRTVYQTYLGGLMYAAITTRPDIAFTVQHLSQFSSNPAPAHLTAIKRCYRYLQGTQNLGITFNSKDNSDLHLFSDADWGSNTDDRRSISGYISTLSGGAVTWQSKKQPTVALSSMEAEYMALANAVKETKWLRSLLNELGLPQTTPTCINVDNQGTIDFEINSGFHARSKHIDIRHHFTRESITSNEVSVQHVASEDNLADIFTKPLARQAHWNLVEKLGMTLV